MKKINYFLIVFFTIVTFSAQEYQYEGMVNGRKATLLLHFVTASDNPDEVWSHGSFYYNDDEKVNTVFQYKPLQPEAGVLTFNMLEDNKISVDYIKGKVSKESFTGVYSLNGKEIPVNFKTKKYNDFIIYNYYKEQQNNGKQSKYFGKFISINNENISQQLVQHLSNDRKKRMPRPYLQHVYETVVEPEFEHSSNSDWIVNYAIYPVISTPDKVVFKVVQNAVKDGNSVLNNESSFEYNTKTGDITSHLMNL